MDIKSLDQWISTLGKAWIEKNPDLIGSICTLNVKYFEHPFEPPRVGRQAVIDEWGNVPKSQKDITFEYDIIGIVDDIGISHWRATYVRIQSEQKITLDGIFTIRLNDQGLCSEFHMWWVVKDN